MTAIDPAARSLLELRAQILERNAALNRAAGGPPAATPTGPASAPTESFGSRLETALKDVNQSQHASRAASEAYERGEAVDVAQVMLARQTASIGFEATLQVRNKLLSAYKDIMSMPV
jgi:flagellar hook-basal body complex protein FliE